MIGVADRLSRIVAEKIELPMRDPARQLKLFVIQFKTATDRLRGLLARISKHELLGGQIRSNLPGLTRIDRDVDFLGSQTSPGYDIAVGKLVEYAKTAIIGLLNSFEAYVRPVLRDIRDVKPYLDDYLQGGDIDGADNDAVIEVERVILDMSVKLERMSKKVEDFWRIKSQVMQGGVPVGNDIETMYHASTNAKKIAAGGFGVKAGHIGLGGSVSTSGPGGLTQGISFTYDLYIAKEIARVFKELAMAARGELSALTIFSWAKKEGIGADVRLVYQGFHGTADMDTKRDAVAMYLAYVGLQKKRYNPGLFHGVETLQRGFAQVNPRDIGVIVAKVNLRGARRAGRTHISSEREIRVLPSDIVSIERVI